MQRWHFSTVYFFYFTTIGVLVPYWGLFLQHRGFNATEIGQLMAIPLLTKMIAPNLWAALADHTAAKKGNALGILKFATLAAFFVYCLLYFSQGFWETALVMLGFCVFWNACLPQLEAATLNYLQDNRDKYGQIRLWGSVSFIVTVLGLGWLIDDHGPNIILWVGGLSFLSVFLASFLMRAAQPMDGLAVDQRPLLSARSMRKLVNGPVIILLLLCLFMQISHAPWQTFFSIYLQDYGYSKFSIGLLFSIGVVFEIGVFIVGYKLLSLYRLSSLLSFTFFIAALRWCLVAHFPESTWIIVITQIMHAVTYGLYHSVMIKLIDRFFQGAYQIRGQALYSSVTFGLGGAIGSFASGYIWSAYGGNALFGAAGVLMFVVFAFGLLLLNKITDSTSHLAH